MRHIMTSFVTPLSPPSFSALSHKRHELQTKVVEHKMCVLIFYTTLFETFLILRRNQRDVVINVETSSHKIPVILVGFWCNLEFSWNRFSKKSQISDLIKIRPLWAELFHADGRTDGHDDANSGFSSLRRRLRIPVGAKTFFLLQESQTGSWAYLSLIFNGYRVFSRAQSAKVKNEMIYTSTNPICFYGMDRVNFTFTLITKSAGLAQSV